MSSAFRFVFFGGIQEYIRNQLREDELAVQIGLKEFVDPFTGRENERAKIKPPLGVLTAKCPYFSTIIVKDMSRLGRDYLQVGYYTDTYFPEHSIRFIAVNDMVDSEEGGNELAPFRNVMNEMYAAIP